ncbi:MAG TPA: ATP phosphoribosyltransferase regulatory subunit [Gemmatimonadales bacterium]|nr:ATP phosphoribosyltransferase regulatory subunit [Gemmatimonadales bacterium]
MPRSLITATPPGALDLSGAAVVRRRALQRATMDVLARAGFQELSPPTFEYEEVFRRAGGAEVAEKLIRFVDLDGRILALRYDFTSSIARMAATTFAEAPLPLKLSYSGVVYRQEPERGRARETLQVGAELIGQADLAADVEIVRLTLALATASGVRDFQLNLGHAGVLAGGLSSLDEGLRADVRRWIDRKDRGSLARALGGAPASARALLELPFVMGRRDVLDATLARAPEAARAPLAHLAALDSALTPEERSHLVYDLGEVRGLDYYTGIHFELFVAGAGRAAGAGGRYDDLMGRFGRAVPAVGVSLDLDALAELPI